MQICDSSNQKSSLFNAMTRFIGAVNNMDQTVMVPSVLRDVPLDDGAEPRPAGPDGAAFFHHDMYSSYVLLKSIRNDMEWGVWPGDERRDNGGATEHEDLEKQFHFHLNGLQQVLTKLTATADTLTNRYKEEIGCRK